MICKIEYIDGAECFLNTDLVNIMDPKYFIILIEAT